MNSMLLFLAFMGWKWWQKKQLEDETQAGPGEGKYNRNDFLGREQEISEKYRNLEQWACIAHVKSKVYKISTWAVLAIIYHESKGNRRALGKALEIGLMQIITKWHCTEKGACNAYYAEDLWIGSNNIDCGCRILKRYFKAVGKNEDRMIMAYNVGPDLEPRNKALAYLHKVKAHKHALRFWWEIQDFGTAIGPMIRLIK